jgi:ferredoxin
MEDTNKTYKTYKVNKETCIGCGSCSLACPEGTEMDTDGKAKVISSAKVEECGGVDLCPYGAIEIENGVEAEETED